MTKTQNLIIRAAVRKDFDDVFQLLNQLWPDVELDREAMYSVLLHGIESQNHEFLCAEVGNRVVGFCSLYTLFIRNRFWQEGLLGFVGELVVDKPFRRRGIGSALLEAAADKAKEKGCRIIELDSALDRKEVHEFYEKIGFKKRAYLFSRGL